MLHTCQRMFCSSLISRNKKFLKKMQQVQNELNLHKKTSSIEQQNIHKFINNHNKSEISDKMIKEAKYDNQLKQFINKFNKQHLNSISLLDFSNYSTSFGQLRNTSLRKQDIRVIQEFQKRKIDQRINQLRRNSKTQLYATTKNSSHKIAVKQAEDPLGIPESNKDEYGSNERIVQEEQQSYHQGIGVQFAQKTFRDLDITQGPLKIHDDFIMLLLNRNVTTKVTTLNRINTFKTLVFMGNGNGVIAYGRSRQKTMLESLEKAVTDCRKNVIAIPRDERCTLPLQINKRWQDYKLYLRPNVGFNSYGHPVVSLMLTLAGIDHCGFKTIHTDTNVHNAVNVLFKALTNNTTPQQLAEKQGFKVYRHQFIRPLTFERTHFKISF